MPPQPTAGEGLAEQADAARSEHRVEVMRQEVAEHVRAVALQALRHRILLNFEGEAEGVKTDAVIQEILAKLPE